jgi:hypothetical protein
MKPFRWKKFGLLFDPKGKYPWMQTHAQVPYSMLFDNFIRVYFSTREKADDVGNFRSHSGFVDLDRANPTNILNISVKPIIELGQLGEFDEFGSMAGSVVENTEKEYLLYYCGWQRCSSVPYNWSIGLAKSSNGTEFVKISKGPLIGPSPAEPYLQACPIVYRFSKNDWHMYYLSGTNWFVDESGKIEPQYLIMHASSLNGLDWYRDGQPIIPVLVKNECQTSSSILKRDGLYHMFFSYRHGSDFRSNKNRSYRIGYAYSYDLRSWTRNDLMSGIDISESGWDSQMVAYPHVREIDGNIYMFYCGNNFGESGFGYAVLEKSQ